MKQQSSERLKSWARNVKRDVVALYLAGRDPRVPQLPKLIALATAAYALSPIDLIPDFIPILGYLDDLIIVPLAIHFAARLIPDPLMEDLRRQAAARLAAANPVSRTAAIVIVLCWIVLAALTIWVLLNHSS